MPSYPNDVGCTTGHVVLPKSTTAVDSPPSEIVTEQNHLDKMIQQTFESARQLASRLQPICRSYPKPPNSEKVPEEALSDVGSNIRRNRRAVEGINDTLLEILQSLAL